MAKIEEKQSKQKIEITDGVLIPARDDSSIFSAWRISFYGAIAALIMLPFLSPEPYSHVLKFIIGFDESWHFDIGNSGLVKTFEVTVLSIFFALFIGLLVGLGRISRISFINRLCTVYVEVIRGIPLLVQLFYIYYALAKFVKIMDISAAVIAMAICYGAYIGEIFRAGIQSIPKGQMEAALALGMSRSQAIYRIILPQTIKVVLPPIGNEFIALLKDSSLVSILAVSDLLRRGREYASTSFYYFETYTMVAIIYLILTLFFSRLVAIMEERMKINANQS
ncbi:MAG TPA: amino acid ABC transporter permease [Spirochaetota bacterium]|nr:amino acid ABC transporter permease [Spirochaetota bacterium]HON14883.1 amino acid ABC transporter permease [Spirochaetota bacterium]HPD76843.1 amino acid ABC transporter permease [Spirochaetota bacterium]HRS61964.1 amino acid ABC transporter permease [Spirochaetota bacterium]